MENTHTRLHKPLELQKKSQKMEERGEEGRADGGGDTPVISFLQTFRWKTAVEGRRMAEGDPGREQGVLLGMNNGWRILRDLVKTLIMDHTQLEGSEEKRRPSRKF